MSKTRYFIEVSDKESLGLVEQLLREGKECFLVCEDAFLELDMSLALSSFPGVRFIEPHLLERHFSPEGVNVWITHDVRTLDLRSLQRTTANIQGDDCAVSLALESAFALYLLQVCGYIESFFIDRWHKEYREHSLFGERHDALRSAYLAKIADLLRRDTSFDIGFYHVRHERFVPEKVVVWSGSEHWKSKPVKYVDTGLISFNEKIEYQPIVKPWRNSRRISPYLGVAISSHVSSYESFVPDLTSALRDQGLNTEDVQVFVGGCDEERAVLRDECVMNFVSHNSFDHTAHIGILERDLLDRDWFIMHDTCEIQSGFVQKMRRFPAVDYRSITDEGWLNMGYFSAGFLERHRDYIFNLKNASKLQAIFSEKMYNSLCRNPFWYQTELSMDRKSLGWIKGKQRQILNIDSINLLKYQSMEAKNIFDSFNHVSRRNQARLL